MAEIYGIILLIILVVYCYSGIQKKGIVFLFNYGRLGVLIWTLGLGLYDLQLSNLYHPDFVVNLIGTIMILNFALLTKFLPDDNIRLIEICDRIELPKKGFLYALYFTLLLGVISFYKNYSAGLLRFFISNKGMRADIGLSYFFHAMVVVSICFYILFREEKNKGKKLLYLILSIVTIFMEFTNLARGPLMFWLAGIMFYEMYKYIVKRKSAMLTSKHVILIILLAIVAMWAFGKIGDSRTSAMFGSSAQAHYKMSENIPTGFTWVYIYITSPLENLRYSLAHDVITEYGYFNKLLYPIIKFGANIIGQGANYKSYVNSIDSVTPYLWNNIGLNMSTFAADAYQDASYLGIFVYIIIYDLIGFVAHKILNSKIIPNISKIIIYPLLLEIVIWSIFTSSILGVVSIWSDIVFILMWSFGHELYSNDIYFNWIKNTKLYNWIINSKFCNWIKNSKFYNWIRNTSFSNWVKNSRFYNWIINSELYKWINNVNISNWIINSKFYNWIINSKFYSWISNINISNWIINTKFYSWIINSKFYSWISNINISNWIINSKFYNWIINSKFYSWISNINISNWIKNSKFYKWIETTKIYSWIIKICK